MLINAQSREEIRIAVLADSILENYQVEVAEGGLTRGNIYRGLIANLQPALDAAFVEYGAARNGFLALQDVVPEARYKEPKGSDRPRIDSVLEKGKPIVVQVERDPEGQKGSNLTTNLSFAGRYLVLTPFDDTRGVSRKVEDEEMRSRLKELAHKLELPDGCGVIVRTNALDQTRTELQRDLAALLRVWKRVQQEAISGNGARLLYSDQDIVLRALRDHLDSSVEEVIVDDDAAFAQAESYMQAFMPRSKALLVRWEERGPLFSRYAVESQIERIFARSVSLPSGGAIVIDPTEALTAIDVNSGRSSGGGHEEMVLRTNLEAAREVARQLRLRDLGGLVVVDFIDLRNPKNRRAIEKEVKESLKPDRARSSVGRISSNGLLEINRQKIQRSLSARAHRPCATCGGTGRVPSIESIGLNLLRRIEGRAATGRLLKARVELHPELAEAIQNGRRRDFARLETDYDIEIEIVASQKLNGPEEQIEWRDRQGAAGPAPLRPVEPVSRRASREAPVVFEITPVDGGEDEEGNGARNGRKRRRRGGRRRKKKNGVAATPAGEAVASDETGSGEPEQVESEPVGEESTADSGSTNGPRRRRRRGGRRRTRRVAGDPSVDDGAPDETPTLEPPIDESPTAASPIEEPPPAKEPPMTASPIGLPSIEEPRGDDLGVESPAAERPVDPAPE
jgi:ribonuclease E